MTDVEDSGGLKGRRLGMNRAHANRYMASIALHLVRAEDKTVPYLKLNPNLPEAALASLAEMYWCELEEALLTEAEYSLHVDAIPPHLHRPVLLDDDR